MKFRSGFVSNSSSSSFIVVGHRPPVSIEHQLVNPGTAKRMIEYMIHDIEQYRGDKSTIPRLQAIDTDKQAIWLTQFMSDSGEFTSKLDDDGLQEEQDYFDYCSGGHGGPYNEADFINLGNTEWASGVWVRREDYVHNGEAAYGQMELPFTNPQIRNYDEDEDDLEDESWDEDQ